MRLDEIFTPVAMAVNDIMKSSKSMDGVSSDALRYLKFEDELLGKLHVNVLKKMKDDLESMAKVLQDKVKNNVPQSAEEKNVHDQIVKRLQLALQKINTINSIINKSPTPPPSRLPRRS